MVTDNHYRWDFIGLSTDEKPTPATSPKVVDGSTFYCSDNSKLYVYCKTQWYEKTATGGGGTTYTAGDGITISDDTISADLAQTTGTDTKKIMSQNATSSMVFNDPSSKNSIQIGNSANSGSNTVAIGRSAYAGSYNGAIAIGAWSSCNAVGEMNIGSSNTNAGYNGTNYRLLSGVHDPQTAHDAATKGYVESQAGLAKVLSSADYNEPEENPTRVNLFLLPPGLYYVQDTSTNIRFGKTDIANFDTKLILLTRDSISGQKVIQMIKGGSGDSSYPAYVCSASDATAVGFYLLSSFCIKDNLTTSSDNGRNVLSAYQGYVLKGLIDGLDQRITALGG